MDLSSAWPRTRGTTARLLSLSPKLRALLPLYGDFKASVRAAGLRRQLWSHFNLETP